MPATRKEMVWIGAGAAAVGVYFMLVGVGLLPIPGGKRNLHSPLWVVLCAGIPFFFGGLTVFLQGIGKIDHNGETASGAPAWRIIQYLMGVTIFACFALVGTWIALAGESGQFSASLAGSRVAISAIVARTAFGVGAVISWLCTIGYAVSGVRKLRAGSRTPQAPP